jgi:polar amino acid transport system ATP-binding protein
MTMRHSATRTTATAGGDGASTSPPVAVDIRKIRKSFGHLEVLAGVDLTITEGSVTAILGPSGSGKSTLLRTINHLERPDSGCVRVYGELIGVKPHGDRFKEISERALRRQRAQIGFVFQNFNLFPHLTILDNIVEAPVHTQGRSRDDVRGEARDLLAQVGLSDKAAAYPRQLSGGQQQRVAIARAVALKPRLILFDEPTSALDPELVGEVLAVIRRLADGGTTLAIVTHEVGFAREVADQIVFLDQGRVVAQGPPAEVIDNPQNARVRDFLSKVL